MSTLRKPRNKCINCENFTNRRGYIYCSNKCQSEYQYKQYIKGWLSGEIVGLQRLGVVSNHVKHYLRDKYSNKCCLCGWAEVNTFTGIVPLVADHIDGNWLNNQESNLRLICPNCDSLTSTYAALNRGRGRKDRVISKRTQHARLLMPVKPKINE